MKLVGNILYRVRAYQRHIKTLPKSEHKAIRKELIRILKSTEAQLLTLSEICPPDESTKLGMHIATCRANSGKWVDTLNDHTLYSHDQFGDCFLQKTDGVHGVIKVCFNEQLVEIHMSNLTEYVGVKTLSSGKVRRDTDSKPKKDKSVQLKEKAVKLLQLCGISNPTPDEINNFVESMTKKEEQK